MRTLARAVAVPAAALITILAAVGFSARPAAADTISVSPPKFELFGNPGDTVTEKIKVSNDGSVDATYQTDVEDFSAAGDEGGINIDDDANAPTTNFSLRKWVTLEPSSLTVPAGQSKYITATIKIPKGAEPGGHYASVQVKLASGAQVNGGASVQSNLNTLLLLRVSGNITEKLKLDSFSTNQNYYQSGPVTFDLRTSNEGNVHVAPTGTIVVTDMFNHKVAEIPLTSANVLPGAARAVHTTWTSGSKIGRFTATLVASYGDTDKQQLTASTTFIILPLYLIWIALGAVAALYLAVTRRKALKRFLNRLTSD